MMACSRSCSRILGVSLGISAQFAAGANLALFFPDWEVAYLKNGLIGKHAMRGSGIWGGGLMVLFASILITMIGWRQGCFSKTGPCKSMLVSMLAGCLAVLGAFVCFITSGVALKDGPFCMFDVPSSNETQASKLGYPFKDLNDRNYLYDRFLWDSVCTEPPRAVTWHVIFFSTLLSISIIQILLVVAQLINSFLGLFCGFFEKREVQLRRTYEGKCYLPPEKELIYEKRTNDIIGRRLDLCVNWMQVRESCTVSASCSSRVSEVQRQDQSQDDW